jgi:ankyrin repeat protein
MRKTKLENFSSDHPSALNPTSLFYAAVCGFSGLVKHLIVVHAEDVNTKDGLFGAPLHAASVWGHVDVARVLLGYKADVNARRPSNWTPLHCASRNGHLELVQLLLEHKADITAQSKIQRHSPNTLLRSRDTSRLWSCYLVTGPT